MRLSSSQSVYGGVPVLHLALELDSSNARELGEVVGAILDDSDVLIVDLKNVSYVPSVALGQLIAVNSRTRSRRGGLVIAAPSTDVRRLFHLTGLDDTLHVLESVEEAADYLRLVNRRRDSNPGSVRPTESRANQVP